MKIRLTNIRDIVDNNIPIFNSIRDFSIAYHIRSEADPTPINRYNRTFYVMYNFLEYNKDDLLNINNIFRFLLLEVEELDVANDSILLIENSSSNNIILSYVDRSFHGDYVMMNKFPREQGYTLKLHKKKHIKPFRTCDIIGAYVLAKVYVRYYEFSTYKNKYMYLIFHEFQDLKDARDFYSSDSAIININLPIRFEISSNIPDVFQ